MRLAIIVTVACGTLGALPQIGLAQSSGNLTVGFREKAPYGKYLTDGGGRSLYLLTADTKGRSSCYNACAKAWPPLLSSHGTPAAAPGAEASKVSLVPRTDGTQQVAYNGIPLYYFTGDQQPGSTAGEEIKNFGGTWYLVSPKGEKIEGD